MMNDRLAIREFFQMLLSRNNDRADFLDSELLAENGRLQSIDMLEVVIFLEERYEIDLVKIGFDQSQIGSIDNIMVTIGRK